MSLEKPCAATAEAFSGIRAFVFDGDDTLWHTEGLYDEARKQARQIVASAGADGEHWEALERRIDVENVARMGFNVQRFPRSCIEAYLELCRGCGQPIDPGVTARIRNVANSVFEIDPPLVFCARKVLERLAATNKRLGLLTKGDGDVQRRKVQRSGLCDLFDLIEIVPEKTPEVIRALVFRLGVKPESACMIGNSIRSDLIPALNAGLRAIWIDAHVWEYERYCNDATDNRIIRLSSLEDVLMLVNDGSKEI